MAHKNTRIHPWINISHSTEEDDEDLDLNNDSDRGEPCGTPRRRHRSASARLHDSERMLRGRKRADDFEDVA